MGVKKIHIILQGVPPPIDPKKPEKPKFAPGAMVSGELILQITGSRPHDFKQLIMKLRGEAKTQWESSVSNKTYKSREPVLQMDSAFTPPSGSQDGKFSLPPGEHRMPFAFQLPPHLPPSLKTGKGKVRYMIKGRAISSSFFKMNGKTEYKFEVTPHFDLNEHGYLKEEKVISGNQTKQTLLDENVAAPELRTPRTGYVPGETIHVYISGPYEFFDWLKKHEATVKLKQQYNYLAGSDDKEKKVELAVVTPDDWRHVQIKIPEEAHISMVRCTIINISHYITITPSDPKLRLPIVIGTVPFNDLPAASGFR